MSSIQTAIELQDNFTGILLNVINTVNTSVSRMEQMQSVMNEPIDTTSIQGIREQLNQATLAAQELGAAMRNVDMGQVSAAPFIPVVNMPGSMSTDVRNTSLGTQQIQEITSRLNNIVQMQNTIRNIGESLYVIPENAAHDISKLNIEVSRLQAGLDFLTANPFELDSSVVELQINAIEESIDAVSAKQQEVNELIGNTASHIPPVEVPVTWNTDTLEVFTGTGIERFEQEAARANALMEQLSETQNAIARQSYNSTIFPPQAFQDLNSMSVRIDMISSRIQQITSNPLNIGTDIANSELEQLVAQFSQAVQEQENLNHAIESMDVQTANEAYLRLSEIIDNTERHIRDNVDEQGRFNQEIEQGVNEADQLMQKMKGGIAAYASLQTLSTALNLSDQLISTTARLDLMNDGLQTTQDLQNMIYLSAERSRSSYQATADAVSKMGLLAGNAFNSSEEIIAFMEQINKQFQIAGTEASGINAAMLQLTQAMGSGILRGEEYNSVLEQAPNIMQNIVGYIESNNSLVDAIAAEMGMKSEELAGNVWSNMKDIASNGLLSAKLVKNAMFWAADETNAKFESMPMTFSQIGTSLQRTASIAFQPVLEQLNEIANNEAFQEFINKAVEALSIAAGIALEIISLLISFASVVADNWSAISPIVYGAAAALAVYYGWQLLCAIATGVMSTKQNILNAVMAANPIMLVVLAIIALVALFYAAVAAVNHFAGTSVSATGLICGAFAALGAFLLNTVIGAINAILQIIWLAVEPFISIIEWVLNIVNGGFDSFGGAVANLIGNIISWFLSLGKVVTKIIDAIFGSDFTSGLNSLQESVLSWGKNEDAITLDRAAPMIDYRMDYDEAWDAGYSFGEGIDESIANFDLSNWLGTDNIPNQDDYKDLSNYVVENVDDIAGNTEAIKDAVDITEEDLKYLRDIAEQETVNRFTTAEIHIDQTNYNTISSGMDLDGIVDGLTDAIGEAVNITAEGVHE